ncbi:MAG: COX15/CtaA family protein, partial [Myxococcota bacterium]
MKLDLFQRSALATTMGTYLLIAVGALVRAAGAGLGCPDWPRCFGRWIPPMTAAEVPPQYDPALFNFANTWTEYVNRLIGAAVGLLIFATLVLAIRHYRRSPRVLWPTVAAFILVGFEGWLGGQVVRSMLKPMVLTAHLIMALIIVSLLLYATVSAFFPPDGPKVTLPEPRKWVGRAALAAGVLVLLQVAIGALVRGQVQLLAEAGVARVDWIGQLGLIDVVHRNTAVLTTAAVIGVTWLAHRWVPTDRWLKGASSLAAALVVFQVVAGLALAYADFPRVMQVAHLWLASLLLGALTVVAMLAYRIDPRLKMASEGA